MDEFNANVIRSRTNHTQYHHSKSRDIDISCRNFCRRTPSSHSENISKTSKEPAEMESNSFPS